MTTRPWARRLLCRLVMRINRGALLLGWMAALSVGCGRPWPTVHGAASPALATGLVQTVDILPLDVGLMSHRDDEGAVDELVASFDPTAVGAIEAGLARRGYVVRSVVAWDGRFEGPDGRPARAYEPDEVAATNAALAVYGGRRAIVRGVHGIELPPAELPVRLGAATGADATLYVGGTAFEGKDQNVGRNVALVVFAVVFIVVVVAVLAATKGKGGGGGGKGGGGGLARAAHATGNAAVRTTRAISRPLRGFGRGMMRLSRDFGRGLADAHIEVHTGGQPMGGGHVMSDAPPKPRGRSFTIIEMTLVDNQTGAVLWHARQSFPANPKQPEQVAKVMRRMLDALPDQRAGISMTTR
jgi:hypothetical protein